MPRPRRDDSPDSGEVVTLDDEMRDTAATPEPYGYAVSRPTRREQIQALEIDAMVVYLGRNPHYAIAFEGCTTTVTAEKSQGGVRRWLPSFDRESLESYDFSAPERRTSDDKPFTMCRHLGHLALFMRMLDADGQPLFEVRCQSPEDRARIEAYLRRLEQAEKAKQSEIDEIYKRR